MHLGLGGDRILVIKTAWAQTKPFIEQETETCSGSIYLHLDRGRLIVNSDQIILVEKT